MMKKNVLLLTFCCLITGLWAQLSLPPQYILTNKWKWIENGDTLRSALSGAMNAPQIGKIDLDFDGHDDIVTFDREDDSFTPYLFKLRNGQVSYEYAPAFKKAFETCDCQHWAMFQDMNCDGKNDLFCGDQDGNVKVFEAKKVNNQLFLKPRIAPEIIFQQPPGYIPPTLPLTTLITDFPAIEDIDGDGDVDFLCFSTWSNYVEFYQNMAVEQTGSCDTMIFAGKSFCWGHFYEDAFANNAYLNDTSFNCPLPPNFHPLVTSPNHTAPVNGEPTHSRHAGSTLLMLNLDGDTLQDMIVGDVSYSNDYALYNKGAKRYAYIDSVETMFPKNDVAVKVDIFPANFYIDIDNDNVKDLLAAPNTVSGSNNYKSIPFYKNFGQNNHPVFHYQNTGFLQTTCAEFGAYSHPAFWDFDNDGLLDLLVGNGFYEDGDTATAKVSSLSLYKNVGSAIYPAYQLENDNFLNFATDPALKNLRYLTPTVADIDNDGDKDIFVGNYSGTILHFKNTNNTNFQLITNKFEGIDVGLYSAPTFHDIDGDNDLDLFVGERKGYLTFFKNNGNVANMALDSVTNKYGNIKANDIIVGPNVYGYSKPFFVDYNQDGTTELLLGAVSGVVEIYDNLSLNTADTLHLVDTLFHHDFGNYASPIAAKIDSSQKWAYVVGIGRGGLQVFSFETPDAIDTSNVAIGSPTLPKFEIKLFPNPNDGSFTLTTLKASQYQVQIINQFGQIMYQTQFSGMRQSFNLNELVGGIYYVKVVNQEGQVKVEKWIKQ